MCVLLNVTREKAHAVKLAESFDGIELLVDLMQMFRDKKQIFVLSCELLCRLAGGSQKIKSDCAKAEMRKRLEGIMHIMQRKGKIESKINFVSKKTEETKSSPSPMGLTTPIEHMTQLMKMLD